MLVITTFTHASAATIQMGDVNGDGSINIMDATRIQRKLSGITTSEKYYSQYADYDHNGRVDVTDVTYIQKHLTGSVIYNNTYLFLIENNTASILKYFGRSQRITVPNNINNLDVTTIHQKAFADNTKLTTVILPSTIKKLNDYAFYNCSELTTIYTYNKNLIWGNSFVNCPKFQTIKFK